MGRLPCPGDPGARQSQRRGPQEPGIAAPRQDRRSDRLAGSRAPGIELGCPLGLGGSGFCCRLGGCAITSRLSYPARDTRLGGGGGHRADPGTLCHLLGP